MFKELENALAFDKFYAELDDVGKRLHDAGIKYNSLSRWSKDKSEKLPESKIGELQEIARKCVDGAAELDRIIEGFKSLRDNLARHVFQIRDAFPSFNVAVTNDMCMLAEADNAKTFNDSARSLLAKFLGYEKLPDGIVNVDLFMHGKSTLAASFGIRGKPTRVGITIPAAVDYAKDHRVQELMDAREGFSEVAVDDLRGLIPELVMEVSPGVGVGDCTATRFCTVQELKAAIDRLFCYDARNSIRKVEDIDNVRDADDFSQWRMLRAANRRAAENG